MSKYKIKEIDNDVKDVKNIMKENVLIAIDNVDKLNELDKRAQLINDDALQMKNLAKNVKNNSKFCSPGVKILFIILSIIAALVLCYFIASYIHCGSANLFC